MSPNVNVLVLDHSSLLSGAEVNLAKLLIHAPELTATVVLSERGPLEGVLARHGIAVEVLTSGQLGITAGLGVWGAMRAIPRGIALVREVRAAAIRIAPDVIYTNSARAHVYGSIVGAWTRIPVVMHAHEYVDRATYSPILWFLLKLVFRFGAARVISNSASTRETVPRAERQRALDIVLDCPLDKSVSELRVAGGRTPLRDNFTRFIVVGRIAPWKGQHIAVLAFAKWLKESEMSGALTVLGGPLFGEVDYEAELRSLVSELGIQDSVRFLGHLAPEDVEPILDQHDVMLHTSTRPEPFGQVVVEAMSRGLVVLAAGAGGPAESIHSGEDGLLYPLGDWRELARSMVRVSVDVLQSRKIAAAALSAVERYGYDNVVPRFVEVLRSAC